MAKFICSTKNFLQFRSRNAKRNNEEDPTSQKKNKKTEIRTQVLLFLAPFPFKMNNVKINVIVIYPFVRFLGSAKSREEDSL